MMINGSMIIATYGKIAISDSDNSDFSINEIYQDHHEKNSDRNSPKTH